MGSLSNPVSMPYTLNEIATISHTQVANNAYEDWDISGSVPVGTKIVEVSWKGSSGATVAVRKKGGANDPVMTCDGMSTMLVEPNSSRVIEVKSPSGAAQSFRIARYWV